MSFFPKSLLGRTAFFVTFLVILTQLASTFVVQRFYTQPLQQRLIEDRVYQIKNIITSLAMLDDNQRAIFIASIRKNEHATILSDKSISPPPEAQEANQDRLIDLESRLKREVSPDSKIYVADSQTIPKIWIHLITSKGNYWYITQRLPFDADFPVRWTIALILLLVLSLIGLYFGVKHLIKPINQLTSAARSIAIGELTNPVPEHQGPEEIKTLSRIFNVMQHSLEEIESNRSVMLAGVSHDLRTPLSRLRLAIELTQSDDEKNTEFMIQDIEEIESTLNQFMDFARLKNEHWLTKTNINFIADKVGRYFLAREYPITLKLEAQVECMLNPKSMERVIINLVENARRYGKPPIHIETSNDLYWVHLNILDKGSGFGADETAYLLKPFTRKNDSRTGTPGTGLGLAIVNRIVKLHHGLLQFKILDNQGFLVKVSLPIVNIAKQSS